jgi:Ca2+-transporting ATPase
MVYIFAYRSLRLPLWRMNPLSANRPLVWAVVAGIATALIAFLVPGLREVLGIVPLSLAQWALVGGVALGLLGVVEAGKAISGRMHGHD